MILNSPTISGSLTVTGNIITSGSITLSGSVASSSYADTASFVALAQSASYVLTAQTASFVANAQTASFVALAQSASNAVSAETASFANAFTVASTLTAQTLVVQTITSSVSFITGSTKFGSIIDNTHQFTGSLYITGSVGINAASSFRFNGVGDTSHAVGYDSTVDGAFLRGQNGVRLITGAGGGTARMFISSSGNIGIGTGNPSALLHLVQSTSNLNIYLQNTLGSGRTWAVNSDTNGKFNIHDTTANRLTITSDGNVGIGTSSPNLSSYGSNVNVLTITGKTTGYQGAIELGCPVYAGTGATLGTIGFVNGTNLNASIESYPSVSANDDAYIKFSTRATGGSITERMRITSAGFLKASNNGNYSYPNNNVHETVSSTTGDYVNVFTNTSTNPYGTYIRYSAASPNGSLNEFLICGDTTNVKFIVLSSGTAQNRTGVYGSLSDISLKENILDATPKLNDLLNLKVRNFNFIGEELKQIGFVAQEVEEVFPNMIDTNKEGLKSVKTTILIPMLVKAIQELKTQNDALQSRIETLESK